MSKANAAAQIRLANPTLSNDLQDKFQLVINTACRVDTVTSFASGSPDQHDVQEYENLIELLREENGLLHQHVTELGDLIFKMVQVYNCEPHSQALIQSAMTGAIKNCLNS